MAHPHQGHWYWAGSALTAGAAALASTAGGIAATKTNYPLWTAPAMIVAYVMAALAVLCFLGALRGWRFPLAKLDDSPLLQQRAPRRETHSVMGDDGITRTSVTSRHDKYDVPLQDNAGLTDDINWVVTRDDEPQPGSSSPDSPSSD